MASGKEYTMKFTLNAATGSNFSSAFSEAQASLKAMQTEISALNKTQSNIASYQKQQAAVEATAQKLETLKQRHNEIQQEIEETDGYSSTLTSALIANEAAIDRTETALGKQTEKLDSMGAALEEAGVDTNNLTDESQRLEQETEELKEAQEKVAESAEEMGKSGTQAVSDLEQALVNAGIVAALKEIAEAYAECISTFGDFEEEMSKVEALSGASAEEMDALSAAAQEMGATTSYTASEAAEALSYMALAGWDTESMLEGLEPILNLAAASAMDLGEASDIVTDYLTAFGLAAEDAAGFVDMMAYAQANSNTTTSDLGEAYKNCAATATSLGYSAEEVTATLMTMANAGVKGGEAGTALNTIMTRLATNTKGCGDALKEYGVDIYDAQGNMNSLSEILTGMSGVWSTLTDEEQANLAKTIAGTNQYSALQTVMQGCSEAAAEGGQSFSDYAAALEDCTGTAATQAETMLDNLNGEITLMNSALDGLKIAIGEELSPVISDAVEVATEALTTLTNFVNACPGAVTAVTAFVGVMGLATAAVVAFNAAGAAMEALAPYALFLGIAAGVGVFAAGAAGLSAALADATSETAEFAEEAEALTATFETTAAAYQESMDTMDAEYESIGDNVARLEELAAQTELTAAEKEELNAIIETLNGSVDGLSLSYDEETNSLNMTTDAIREMVAAQQEQAEYAAKVERYTELLEEQAQIEDELEGKAEELNAAWGDVADEAANYHGVWNYATSAAYKNAQNLQDGIDDLTDSYEANEEELAELEDYINGYAAAQEDAGGSTDDATEAVDNLTASMDELIESYQEAYNEAYESFHGMFDLFDEADMESEEYLNATVENAQAALDSQLAYWETYTANINALKELSADDLGITEEAYQSLIEYVSSGTEEAAGLAASMVEEIQSGNTDAVTDMAETIVAVNDAQEEAAAATAEWVTGLEESAQELVDEFEQAVEDMELSDEAAAAGESTMSAYVEGLNTYSAQAIAVAQQTADRVAAILSSSSSGSGSSNNTISGNVDAYASGTTSAAEGLALVGENGPELVYFGGGEQVVNAAETQAMMNRLAIGNRSDAAPVEAAEAVYTTDSTTGGAVCTVNFAPVYHINGGSGDEVRTVLAQHDRDMKEELREMLKEIQADDNRRRY